MGARAAGTAGVEAVAVGAGRDAVVRVGGGAAPFDLAGTAAKSFEVVVPLASLAPLTRDVGEEISEWPLGVPFSVGFSEDGAVASVGASPLGASSAEGEDGRSALVGEEEESLRDSMEGGEDILREVSGG